MRAAPVPVDRACIATCRAPTHARIDPAHGCRPPALRPRPTPRSPCATTSRSRRSPPRDWDALAGGTAARCRTRSSRALHETGCAAPRHRLDAALSHRVARRHARRRAAALRQDALVRRVRVRLGLGRCLSPPRPPLLPEARRGDSVHAGAGPRLLARDDADARRAARRRALDALQRVARRRRRVTRRCTCCFRPRPRPRACAAPGMIVRHGVQFRLGEPRLPRLRRLPRDVQPRQAQEGEAGAAQGSPRPASRSRARSAARSRPPTGRSSTAATSAPTASITRRRI